eukprot:s5416_g1.t5
MRTCQYGRSWLVPADDDRGRAFCSCSHGLRPSVLQVYIHGLGGSSVGHARAAAVDANPFRPLKNGYPAMQTGLWPDALHRLSELDWQGIRLDIRVHGVATNACDKGCKWRRALSVLHRIHTRGLELNVVIVSSVVSASGKGGCWHGALDSAKELACRGIETNTVVANSAITACTRHERWQHAAGIFSECTRGGVLKPDVVTYGAMLSALEKGDSWQQALQLLSDMRGMLMEFNGIVCTTAFATYGKSGQWVEAAALLEEVLSEELGFGTVVVNAAITAFCRTQQWQRALCAFFGSRKFSLESDMFTLSSVLSACDIGSQWQLASGLWTDLCSGRLQPSIVTCNVAVHAAASSSQWQDAGGLLQRLRASMLQLDGATCSSAIGACRWDLVLTLLQDADGTGLVHDEVTRSVAAKVCLSGQRWQTAVTLLSLGEGPVDVATSTTAMAAFSDGFAWKVAFHLLFKGLLGKCFERGWAALHTAAVTMCGRHIQWRGAVALLQKFVDRRCDVSVDTCSAALKACADGEQWQGSVSLLFCMDQLHLQPDALSFSPVISACRNWQLGLLLFHNMVSRQLKPNVITCNAVLSMCEGSGRWQQAILLLTRLHAENIEPDTMSYNLALGACTKAKRWRAAAALFLQMGRIHVPGNAMTFSRLIEQREMSSFDFRSCDLLQGAGIRSLTRLCDRGGSLFQKKGSSACAFRSFTATLIPCLSCDISSTAIHLTNVFERYGMLDKVHVISGRGAKGYKSCAYVEFRKLEDAEAAQIWEVLQALTIVLMGLLLLRLHKQYSSFSQRSCCRRLAVHVAMSASLSSWSLETVVSWLQKSGHDSLVPVFEKERIDGQALQSLTLDLLKKLEVSQDQAKALLASIADAALHSADVQKEVRKREMSDRDQMAGGKVVLLMGPPASGKSTLGENLAKHFKGKHIDLGVTLREISSRPPEDILVEALREEMEEAVRTVTAKPAHLVFVNGFPRMMDGFRFWQNHTDLVKPSLVLVVEAPDDVLKRRAEQRGREGDEKFDERLGFYRASTEPVIFAFRKAGITRQIDATGSPELLLGSARFHMQPSFVFACGDPKLYGAVCREAVARLGTRLKHINVDRIREAVGSKFLAPEILKEVAMYGPWGSPFLLEGFPRDVEELKTLPEDGLVTLDFNSGLVFSQCFVRSFQDAEAGSVDAVAKLLQCCQPLQVSPIFSAIGLLKSWMDTARHMPWWDFSFFLSEAQPSYLTYMRQESALAARHAAEDLGYMRPSMSPPMDAWLCWFTHQLHTDDYAGFCKRLPGVGLGVGPLPPATWKARDEAKAAVEKKPTAVADSQISMEADALVNVPTAFVLAFAAFEEAGLSPLTDPRAIVFKVNNPAAKQPDLMSRFLKLIYLYYRRFLIIMGEAGPESLAGPAVELDWIWHAHMTHPLYSEDCRRTFGHLLPHVPCKPGESERIRSSPKDAGRVAMSQLNEMLRSQLHDLARSTHLQDALKWEFQHSEADDAVALGCFIPGGDRAWLAEKLKSAGGRLGQAFLKSLRDPETWTCPSPTQNGLTGDSMKLNVSVQLMSGEKVLDRVMPKTSTVAELAAILRQEGESEDLKFFVQGSEVAADIRLGDTQVARGAVVQLVRIKRPPPVVTRRTSSPDWNRIPCTCFTDFCGFHVLAASGQTTCKFMRDLLEGDMVRTGSSVESEKYRQISRIWCCTAGLTQTVEVEQGCKLTVGHPVLVNGSWCRPETCKQPSCSYEEHVYTLELEGHVDTVLVGSHGAAVVCAALGTDSWLAAAIGPGVKGALGAALAPMAPLPRRKQRL